MVYERPNLIMMMMIIWFFLAVKVCGNDYGYLIDDQQRAELVYFNANCDYRLTHGHYSRLSYHNGNVIFFSEKVF